MHPISGRFTPSRAHGAGPVHHAARQADALDEFLKNAQGVFDKASKEVADIRALCGDLPAAKLKLSQKTTQGLHGAINGMFNSVKKDLLRHAETAWTHRRNDASQIQRTLEGEIAKCEECMAENCLQFAFGLVEIAKDTQPLVQKEKMFEQAIGTYEEGLKQIESASSRYLALAPKNMAKIAKDLTINRNALAQSMHSAGLLLRNLHMETANNAGPSDGITKLKFVSRQAEYMDAMVSRHQHAPYLDEVHREKCFNSMALLLSDHSYAADAHRVAARWYMETYLKGHDIDVEIMNRTLELAQYHAACSKHWAPILLEKIKEQSQPRATIAQRALITQKCNDIIALRSGASEVLIESAAIMSWLRRAQVKFQMNAVNYGGEHGMTERLRDWLPAFDERSVALEGTLLTQLKPMLTKQRIDGHHDLSCLVLLRSAVSNLRLLEQEAIAMAASAKELGALTEVVQACDELATQKSQICESLADDLKRLQDYADLVAEPPAPAQLATSQRKAAGGLACGANPEGATAAPAPVLFDTVMEGTLAGREKDSLMLVDNDLTGQVVAYRHGEDGLWQRVAIDAVDADKRAPRRPAASAATASASAKLTGADKVTGKAQQYSEEIEGYLKKMDGEKRFALAQYYHGRAIVAQGAALDYLDRLRSDLLEARNGADALAAAGTERRRVADAGRGMAQRLLAWVALQPQHDNGSLAYLLQHAPNVRVEQTLQRKMLDQAKLTRHNLKANFMDEYTIDTGYRHPPSVVHVHYDYPKAELDNFTACHLKYGDDEAPVRNKVSLELLKNIAGRAVVVPVTKPKKKKKR